MKIFIVLTMSNIMDDIISYRKNKKYKVVRSMSEFLWYDNIIRSLEERGHKVFMGDTWGTYAKYRRQNPIFLVDHNKLKVVAEIGAKYGINNSERVYMMGWWGYKSLDSSRRLKSIKFKDGSYFDLKHNLTAYNWNCNSFLGFNINSLFPKISKRKYENYGLIWGKRPGDVFENWNARKALIEYLCKRGIKLYTVCDKPIDIEGVINLGTLNKLEYSQLLSDSKFFLGLGNPKYGLAVLEALYYKTPIVCRERQLPPGYEKSANCYIYEGKNKEKLADLLENIKFKENDEIVKRDCSVEEYNKRLEKIFK